MDHRVRRDALIPAIEEQAVDAMLVTRLTNVRYLTGFTGSNAQAIVTPASSVFFTDGRYTEQSRHEVADLERVTYLDAFGEPLAEACAAARHRKLGFEAHDVTVNGLRQLQDKIAGVEFVAVGEPIERLRWIKDAEEIALLNEAQSCTDVAFDDILERLGGRHDRAAGRPGAGARTASRRRGRAVVRIDRGVRRAGRRAAPPSRRTGCWKRATSSRWTSRASTAATTPT